MYRAEEIQNEILHEKGNYWSAFDQGRYANAIGVSRESNPYRVAERAIGYHVNMGDWERGWDAEEQRRRA